MCPSIHTFFKNVLIIINSLQNLLVSIYVLDVCYFANIRLSF